MSKVVYNTCYGGFGLSDEAMARYADLKGLKFYPEPGSLGMSHHWLSPRTGIKELDEQRSIFSRRDMPRDDPALAQVVEELGQRASGKFASLAIKDLPQGVLWRIDEYDGMESVKTQGDYEWSVSQ